MGCPKEDEEFWPAVSRGCTVHTLGLGTYK